MVSLSIDEFHIFKAAHRSWTLLALVRISNSRCYTPAEHTVSKNRFFLFLFFKNYLSPESSICTDSQNISKSRLLVRGNMNICYTALFFIFQESTMQSPNNALVLMSWPKKVHFAFISFHSLSPGSYVSTQRSCLKRFLKSIIILLNVFVALSIIIMQAL